MYVILWEIEPDPQKVAEFEEAYGPNGEWARFFRTGKGYRATELLKGKGGVYITIDRWDTAADYQKFRDENYTRYMEIDRECEWLTIRETKIGDFETVD